MGDAVSGLGDPGDEGRGETRGGRDDGSRSPDALEQVIGRCRVGENAYRREYLRAVAEFDRSEAWKADGASSMANWLVRAEALNWSTANDYVRVAHRLEELPVVAATFAEGLLSFDQVRALCRFVTPDDDDEWAERARGMTVDDLHRHARMLEPITAEDDADLHAQRSLTFRRRRDRMLAGSFALAPDDGEVVIAAIERRMQHTPPAADGETPEPGRARMADALVDIAQGDLAGVSEARRSTVTIHGSDTVLADPDIPAAGSVWIEGGPPVSAELARRHACDGYIQNAVWADDGTPLLDGARKRAIPAGVERRVRMRDNSTCRWPGCDKTLFLQLHHIVHWIDGGEHSPTNLICLCTHHHVRLHEDRFTIRGDPNGRVTFHRPDGTDIRAGPDPA